MCASISINPTYIVACQPQAASMTNAGASGVRSLGTSQHPDPSAIHLDEMLLNRRLCVHQLEAARRASR